MEIVISKKALKKLGQLQHPLTVEIELYFSCLIRKRVLFPVQAHKDAIKLKSDYPELLLYFRPVMTKSCSLSEGKDDPELVPFPIVKPERFFPKKLELGFAGGSWKGEYSLSSR